MASGPSVFQHPTFLRGLENLLIDMATQPEMAHWLMDRFMDFYLGFFDHMLTVAKGRIDILRAADDLGTQRGLFLSPEMFRTFIKPRLSKLIDMTHSHGVKFLFHSCGAIWPCPKRASNLGGTPDAIGHIVFREHCHVSVHYHILAFLFAVGAQRLSATFLHGSRPNCHAGNAGNQQAFHRVLSSEVSKTPARFPAMARSTSSARHRGSSTRHPALGRGRTRRDCLCDPDRHAWRGTVCC